MKFHVVSDLHLDHDLDFGLRFLEDTFPEGIGADVDGLIVAGDWLSLHNHTRSAAILGYLAGRYREVFIVPGNHEYWRARPLAVTKSLNLIVKDHPNITAFDKPSVVVVGGVKILGGTMWYPKPKVDTPPFVDQIRVRCSIDWFSKQYYRFINLLDESKPDVVISHHMPSYGSCAPQFLGDLYNHYFISPQDERIMALQPKLWVHGHGHTPFDYRIGNTRVVCNPRGYPHEHKARAVYKPLVLEV